TALNQPIGIVGGSTIYLRGGVYKGKFASQLTGTAGNEITVKSYPGEWAVIDGYFTTTLNGSISSTTGTITLTDASKLKEGDAITFHDGSEGSEEQVYLNGKSGNTFTSCGRGLNGTTAVSHTSGAMVVLGGNQLTINGSYAIYRDFEIRNSDP